MNYTSRRLIALVLVAIGAQPVWAETSEPIDHVIILNLANHSHIQTITRISSGFKAGGQKVTSDYSAQYDDAITKLENGNFQISRDVSHVKLDASGGYSSNFILASFSVKAFKAVPHIDFSADDRFGAVQINSIEDVRAAIIKAEIFTPGETIPDKAVIDQLDLDPFKYYGLSDVSFYGKPLAIGRTETLQPEVIMLIST